MGSRSISKGSKDTRRERAGERAQAHATQRTSSSGDAAVLRLQHAVGNRAVSHLVRSTDASIGGNALPRGVRSVVNSRGQPLDPATRGLMESRFGHDFADVRVHTDAKAAE